MTALCIETVTDKMIFLNDSWDEWAWDRDLEIYQDNHIVAKFNDAKVICALQLEEAEARQWCTD